MSREPISTETPVNSSQPGASAARRYRDAYLVARADAIGSTVKTLSLLFAVVVVVGSFVVDSSSNGIVILIGFLVALIVGVPVYVLGIATPAVALFVAVSSAHAQSKYNHPTDCWLLNKSKYQVAFTGGNPSLPELKTEINGLAGIYNIPIELIAAVCYHESGGMYQYGADGLIVHNKEECRYAFTNGIINEYNGAPPPGLGLMMLTSSTADAFDKSRLISDWRYNLQAGVQVLSQKYERAISGDKECLVKLRSQSGSRKILENWYHALAYYNGKYSYVELIYRYIATPPSRLSGFFSPVTVTRPSKIPGFATNQGFCVQLDSTWMDSQCKLHSFPNTVHVTMAQAKQTESSQTTTTESTLTSPTRQIEPQLIYDDDFSALTVKGFLGAIQAKDVSRAFREVLRQPPNPQRKLEALKRFIDGDRGLKDLTSFRLLTSRHDPPLARVVAETKNARGETFNVTFIMRGNENDPEGESWEIDRIESESQFPANTPASHEKIPSPLLSLLNGSHLLLNMDLDESRSSLYLIGDFDGDGKQDYAVGVKSKKTEASDLALLFGGGKVVLASSESSIGHNYPGPDWKIIPKLTHIRSRPEYNGGHPAPTLNGDAISLERPESSAAVLYWHDGHLRLYWVSD